MPTGESTEIGDHGVDGIAPFDQNEATSGSEPGGGGPHENRQFRVAHRSSVVVDEGRTGAVLGQASGEADRPTRCRPERPRLRCSDHGAMAPATAGVIGWTPSNRAERSPARR